MRRITLSDHAGEQLASAAAAREDAFAAAGCAYDAAVAERERKLAQLRDACVTAWRRRQLLASCAALIKYAIARFSGKPQLPRWNGPSRDDSLWTAGREGERTVAEFLGRWLSDDWVLVGGYRNGRGEIDQVLVGPRGVLAVEIKTVNGVVHCDGDRWWRDKYDRYGNLVERGLSMEDRGGRGPSKQLNEPADALESFLRKKTAVRRVYRAVVLAHEKSRLGAVTDPRVDAITTLAKLNVEGILAPLGLALDATAVEQIEKTIQRDHEFHATQDRRPPPARRQRGARQN
jgi:hypothetical protein